MERMLTTVEASELTGYHRDYIRRLILEGRIRGERRGRDWFVDKDSLLEHVKAMEEKGEKRGPKTDS